MEDKDVNSKKILSILKDALRWGGSGRVPRGQLIQLCRGQSIDGEIETLIKLEYVRESIDRFAGRSYSYLEITRRGLEFLEGHLQFQQFIIFGDHYSVSMGDNNSNIVIGRDNTQIEVQFGHNTDVKDAIASIRDLAQIKSLPDDQLNKVLSLLDSLQYELNQKAINFDSIEGIKSDLLQWGGEIGAAVAVLFSIPALNDLIKGEGDTPLINR
ncbi:MAG: hypothetical protein HS126_09750 [Anaerolineales bacterium]|nr:hypothetical protein [Anaerolineales bacterium]